MPVVLGAGRHLGEERYRFPFSEITGMTEQTSATPDYTMGYSEIVLSTQLRTTAENSAAFLLPHLGPGMQLLDFGC